MDCSNTKPKWLKLAEGETYLWSQMSWRVLLVIYMLVAVCILLILAVSSITGGLGKIAVWSIIPLLFAIPKIADSIWTNRIHLTSRRLVMEIGNKNAGEIRLDEIKAIQIKKHVIGGNVVISSTIKGQKPLAITAVKPEQFAGEIQQLSAGNDEEPNTATNNKGVA